MTIGLIQVELVRPAAAAAALLPPALYSFFPSLIFIFALIMSSAAAHRY